MKYLLVSLFVVLFSLPVSAQFSRQSDGGRLSDEERQLVEMFRRNPEPFRQVMMEQSRGGAGYGQRNDGPNLSDAVVGPRDVVDVSVSGGLIAFYGKRGDYEPMSFRIARGEEKEIIFNKTKTGTETVVRVAFRSDGLHFDVPEVYDNRTTAPRGLWVISEDGRWRHGEGIMLEHEINSSRSKSKAQAIVVSIRYVSR